MPERGPRVPLVVYAIAAAVLLSLVGTASRYGYHRDELYFVAAGRHLAWGYADQGPVTPLIARAMYGLAPHSLTVLRVPAALSATAIVVLTALQCRELGGDSRAQELAAACSALSVLVLFTGHTLSTTTFDLLIWAVATLLVLRALREERWWILAGFVVGLGTLNKPLPALLALASVIALAALGPRRVLLSHWFLGGAVLAVVVGSPFLIWQATHGWPQLDVARAITEGGSASSQPGWLVVPFQALLAGPLLAPVWIAGLVRLTRDRHLRFLALTWAVLAIAFTVSGGKSYYLSGLVPLLIGAGSGPCIAWATRARARILWAAVALSTVVCPVIALPLLPANHAGIALAANPDVAETIGWPDLVRTVALVYRDEPGAVIVTENYGEAGAIDRYGPGLGLPRAYSGHNAYGYWGHPSADAGPVVVVGYSAAQATQYLLGCRAAGVIHNAAAVDNEESGRAVLVCARPRLPWQKEWPLMRHLG